MIRQETVTMSMSGVVAGNALTAFTSWDNSDGRFEFAPLIRGLSSTDGSAWQLHRSEAVSWHDEPLGVAYSTISAGGFVSITFEIVAPGSPWWTFAGDRPWKASVVESIFTPSGRVDGVQRQEWRR